MTIWEIGTFEPMFTMRVLIGIIEHIVDIGSYVPNKAGKDRDTVSVEPGSRQFFGSVSVSESRFFGYLVLKRHFLLILKILYVCLKSLNTVSGPALFLGTNPYPTRS